jgi:virginiamycin B lyase
VKLSIRAPRGRALCANALSLAGMALVCVVALGGPSHAATDRAQAGEITEFDLQTLNAGPRAITPGTDGHMYFVEDNAGRVGRISGAGIIEEFPAKQGSYPQDIVAGIDGMLWFTETNQLTSIGTADAIGRLNPLTGVIKRFATPTQNANPIGIARAADNSIWFTETESAAPGLGRLDPVSETITEFTAPPKPYSITAGPDNAMWFTKVSSDVVGRVGALGAVTELGPLPSKFGQLAVRNEIVLGPDGALWTTTDNFIVRIATNGLFQQFELPTFLAKPGGITSGPDALWFTETQGNKIGRITPAGLVSEFALPNPQSDPTDIAMGSDGALWFTEHEGNRIGRLVPGDPPIPPIRMEIILRTYKCSQKLVEKLGESFCYLWEALTGRTWIGSISAETVIRIPGGRSYTLPSVRRASGVNRAVVVRGRVPRNIGIAIERSARRGGRPTLTVTLTGRDRRGNSHMVRRTVRISVPRN